ncbi:hypothetical protein EJB05_17521 [Eragrostis curvula]|uniref:Uncharacterized protein n=1 Tax=Eragrostis curvula TaxID=38414 RepID=A0A5J9VH14_9POAL|nr:hypothetical protein EJB05_17521 [Eragrostis curvula]
MACRFSPSPASRLQAVDAAAAGVKSGRVPLKVSVAPAPRSLGSCKATARQEGTTQQEPNIAARTQLDLLEQLTSSTSDGIGLDNGTPAEPRQGTTIREQLSALVGNRVDDYTLPLGKRLKEGLKRLNAMTVSQRRNIKRQALLTKVSGRNDSVFFAYVGAFVLVPPFAILAIAVLTGYVQLFP